MQPTDPPASLGEIAARVEARLRGLLDTEATRWEAVDPSLGPPLRDLAGLVLGGGKRLRPAFCHWAYVGAGGDDLTAVIGAGAAFELLHAFALAHDDVMDGSDRRRGVATTHITYGGRHDAERWRGESRRFGEGVAILVGDLAFVYADVLLRDAPLPAREVWDELRLELNVGQYLDLLHTASGGADLPTARRIASYKSGRYTVERPLHVGAALAGRLDDLAGPLSAYGLPLGEAFQLRDDVLGVFGDAALLGKPVGADLLEGKPTPMLAIARANATGADAAQLERVGEPELDPAAVADLQEVVVRTGALDAMERSIADLTAEAIGAIERAPLSSVARAELVDLAAYVAWRDR